MTDNTQRDTFEILDRATGVPGAYCIARKEGAFLSFWNPSGWAGAGYVFDDRRIAQALIDAWKATDNAYAAGRAEGIEEMRKALRALIDSAEYQRGTVYELSTYDIAKAEAALAKDGQS